MATIRPFAADDRRPVIAVWERSGITRPWNDPGRDIDRKLAIDPDGFLVAEHDGVVVGTVMAGYDGHRGWINYLAVDPDAQRLGVGRALMAAAESLLGERGCPKINLQIRTSNREAIAFYESIGYALDDVVSMGRRLVDDD